MLKIIPGLTLAALLACQPKQDDSTTTDTTGEASTTGGAGFSSTGPGTSTAGTPTTTDASTSLATDDTGSSSTSTGSTTAETGFIVTPDGGDGPLKCDCPADRLCVRSQGVDSWFLVCALPPAGCDPADVCTPACAAACAVPPPQPEDCGGREPPEFLECGDEPGFECSTWTGNCPAGEKCVAHPLAFMECQEIVADPDEIGEPCTGPFEQLGEPDSCVAGAGCWGFDPMTKQQVCAAHCQGTALDPVCPPDTACEIDSLTLVSVCLPP